VINRWTGYPSLVVNASSYGNGDMKVLAPFFRDYFKHYPSQFMNTTSYLEDFE